ncbi:MAG TPA: IS256 family transposase [Caldilineaceae bacterium]|nr:IS256 family transposase [Caldilineaceae bacterium]
MPQPDHTPAHQIEQIDLKQAEFVQLLTERLRAAARATFEAVMEEELTLYLSALPYPRTEQRQGQRNGHYRRKLGVGFGLVELEVPRSREGQYKTQVFERYQRRQGTIDQAISAMFIHGVSTRDVSTIVENGFGQPMSASTVSRVFHKLEAEYETWREAPLASHYRSLYLDGGYVKVRYGDQAERIALLFAVGVRLTGEKELLAFTVGDTERNDAWSAFLGDLKRRGLVKVELIVTDGNAALLSQIRHHYPQAQYQRCVLHKMANVLARIPKRWRDEVAADLRRIFYQPDRTQAEAQVTALVQKWQVLFPEAVACLQRDVADCLTFYAFPPKHWRALCSTNIIERVIGTLQRRLHKMAAAFTNEKRWLLMVYAVLRTLNLKAMSVPQQEVSPTPA